MAKYTFNTTDKKIDLGDGLIITTKGVITIKEKNDITNALFSAKHIGEGGSTDIFFESAVKSITKVITDWTVYDEEDNKLEITEDLVANVFSLDQLSTIISRVTGFSDEVEKSQPQSKKSKSNSKKTETSQK